MKIGRIRFYRMPWALNYRRPKLFRLKDGWHFSMLSFVLIVSEDSSHV